MHAIVSGVAKAAGETAESIRTTRGHILRNLVAWLGWHEGWVTLRSIAASLRLRFQRPTSVRKSILLLPVMILTKEQGLWQVAVFQDVGLPLKAAK